MLGRNLKWNEVTGYFLPLTAILYGHLAIAQISFSSSDLAGINLKNPTTLQFGPDSRLYVGQQDGTIYAYTIQKNRANSYSVTDTETISLINQIPNHDDDGTLNTSVTNRQVTGLLVTGTSENPILYVSSSDPRIGAGPSAEDLNLDTNSGVISKLGWNGNSWDKTDIVRGLPRSEENHSTNGLELNRVNNILYVAQGGHTNAGSPSNNFAFTNEYALSGAILKIDLIDIENNYGGSYDLPTLDDPQRSNSGPGNTDVNDPFGGNDGLNQGKLVPFGPVQIHSPGYRNIYDLVITTTPGNEGRMYTIDNGANMGWGGHPENEGTTNVTNNYVPGEPGSKGPGPNDEVVNNLDNLHFVSGPGFNPTYGGHPNPIRANPTGAGLFRRDDNNQDHFELNPTVDWPPVPKSMANSVESDFRNPGVDDDALYTWGSSTNGLVEYTATNYFNGDLTGDLLTASFDGKIYRIKLAADGRSVSAVTVFASGFGTIPLDVTAQGTGEIFEGTVWTVTYISDKVTVFEPDVPPDNQAPNAIFTASPTAGKAPLTVSLDATASDDIDGTIVSYQWDLGNGNSTFGANTSVTFTEEGTYIIALTTTDDDGASASSTTTIEVSPPNQPPIAGFTALPSSGKAPLTVTLDATSSSDADGTIVDYAWDFGNSTSGSGVNADVTYSGQGTYTITLTVTDDDGATKSSSTNITVNPPNQPPVANFAAMPISGEAPLTVSLDASGSSDMDGSIVSFQWDFGDGTSGSGQTVNKIFNNAGFYTITLTVTDSDGAAVQATTEIAVSSTNIPPQASFMASPLLGEVPFEVNLDASGSSDSDGNIESYHWNFGNGTFSTGMTASVTFTNAGNYTIVLTVTDNSGGTGSSSTDIEATAPNQPPIANFTASPLNGKAPLEVTLDASESKDPDGNIVSYVWDFGNESTGTGSNVIVTYDQPGEYIIELIITDNDGLSASTSTGITINAPNVSPTASINPSVFAGTAPLTVILDASASDDADGQIVRYDWDFGDGTMGTGPNAEITFTDPGVFTVTLTVTDNDGATSSISVDIEVTRTNQPPIANFTASPESGEVPLVVTLDASDSEDKDGTISSYNWDFGNGNYGMGKTVDVVYSYPGKFTIKLIVIDNEGALSASVMEIAAADLVLATGDGELGSGIQLFPNPLSRNLVLKSKNPLNNLKITIRSLSGQLVMENHLKQIKESQKIYLPVSELSRGTYIVTVQTDKQSNNYRMIKQ